MTKLPVGDVRRLDLSVPGYEPRGALDVDLIGPEGRIRVLSTHLGLRPAERRRQIAGILEALDPGPMPWPPTILLGDINEMMPSGGIPVRTIIGRFAAEYRGRSFSFRFAPSSIWTGFSLIRGRNAHSSACIEAGLRAGFRPSARDRRVHLERSPECRLTKAIDGASIHIDEPIPGSKGSPAVKDLPISPVLAGGRHMVHAEPSPKRVRAEFGGAVVADSVEAIAGIETKHLPVYYFPFADIRTEFLVRSSHRTVCPYKGEARYWHLQVGNRREENALWAYMDPINNAAALEGHAAFYWEKDGPLAGRR